MKHLLIKLITLGFALSLLGAAQAKSANYKTFEVTVSGQGKPMLLIPGLNSHGDVWSQTVTHYAGDYQIHQLTLRGFAGTPAPEQPSLAAVKAELTDYIQQNKLTKPVMAGHSLGGFLTLWIASEHPELLGKIIMVDSLPFFAKVQMPTATEESIKPIALGMKQQMLTPMPDASRRAFQQQMVATMVIEPEQQQRVLEWGMTSDPKMTAQAMYDMYVIDLRDDIAAIKTPALVLGSWIAYKNFGATKESVTQVFQGQYQQMPHTKIRVSDTAKHFIMLDDPQWMLSQFDQFLQTSSKH